MEGSRMCPQTRGTNLAFLDLRGLVETDKGGTLPMNELIAFAGHRFACPSAPPAHARWLPQAQERTGMC